MCGRNFVVVTVVVVVVIIVVVIIVFVVIIVVFVVCFSTNLFCLQISSSSFFLAKYVLIFQLKSWS